MASTPTGELVVVVGTARDALKLADDGNIVGREGPRRDVKVLFPDVFSTGFLADLETIEGPGMALRPREHRRHSILINCNSDLLRQ